MTQDNFGFPSDQIMENYNWCKAASRDTALAKMEAFWTRYNQNDERCDDSLTWQYVRHAAFDLAKEYARKGDVNKCLDFIDWIERHG